MKKNLQIFSWIALLFVTTNTWSQPVTFDWARVIGTGSESCAYASVTDASGNVYTVGYFTGEATFPPSGFTLVSKGQKDVFVYAVNSSGTELWKKSFGGAGNDIGKSICIIGSNLYITGTFEGTATFESATPTAVGGTDIFLLKLSTGTGFFSGFRPMGGLGNDDGASISAIGSTHLCLTGSFQGTVDLDPDYALSSYATSIGLRDIFIEKLNLSLTLVWKQTIGSVGEDFGKSVTADAFGNIYTTGSFEDTMDIDPGVTINNVVSLGGSDVFIEKLSPTGNFVWGKTIGDVLFDEGKFIKTDASGNIYSLGNFSGTADFDPGFTLYNLTSNGGKDIFMQKLDSLGNFVNAFSEGGPSDDFGNSFCLDATGNIYCTGSFQGPVDFDPGVGSVSVTSSGPSDLFIQQLDPSFNLLLIKTLQGINGGSSNSIVRDASGNIYTSGSFNGEFDFDPGVGIATKQAVIESNLYLHKLNGSGIYQWVKNASSYGWTLTNDIAVDLAGNIYTAGMFSHPTDFDPGSGSYILDAIYMDPYVQKLDPSGNFLWAVSFTKNTIAGSGVTPHIGVDSSQNVYIMGHFDYTTDFDPGPAVFNITPLTSQEIFIVKLDVSGNLVWVKTFPQSGSNNLRGMDLTVDKMSNIYLTGRFDGTVDFDPGPSVNNLNSVSLSEDVFVCKLNSTGNFIWAKQMGSSSNSDQGNVITTDLYGNPVVAGYNTAGFDADPGSGTFILTNPGAFIIKLDSSGNLIWAKQIEVPGVGHAIILGLKHNSLNEVYFTGGFYGSLDFDPGPATYTMTIPTYYNVFIEKLSATGDFAWAVSIGGPNNELGLSMDVDLFGNCYVLGQIDGPADFDPGPSTYTLGAGTTRYTYIEKLNSNGDFAWAGIAPTKAYPPIPFGNDPPQGFAICVDQMQNIYATGLCAGLNMDLDFTTGSYIVNSQGDRDSYVVKLNQCYDNTVQSYTACTDYTYNGINYTSSGMYGQLLGTTYTGCDSTITLDLTINSPDNMITQSGNVLTASQSGASYQWIDCITGLPIAGETSQSYSIIASGDYAAEINFSGCIDTSACTSFIYTGIPDSEQPLTNVYPSPFKDNLTIEYFDNKHQPIQVEISNLLGQVVYKEELMSDTKQELILGDLQSGIYIVKMYSDNAFAQKQIVRQ